MKYFIDWHFFLAVTNQQKCDKMIQKISEALGTGLFEIKSDRYWKEKALFKADAKSSFDATNSREALDMTMKMIKHLAPSWIVTVPSSDEEPWEFGGASSPGAVRLQGVDSVIFSASQVQEMGLAEAV